MISIVIINTQSHPFEDDSLSKLLLFSLDPADAPAPGLAPVPDSAEPVEGPVVLPEEPDVGGIKPLPPEPPELPPEPDEVTA